MPHFIVLHSINYVCLRERTSASTPAPALLRALSYCLRTLSPLLCRSYLLVLTLTLALPTALYTNQLYLLRCCEFQLIFRHKLLITSLYSPALLCSPPPPSRAPFATCATAILLEMNVT